MLCLIKPSLEFRDVVVVTRLGFSPFVVNTLQ